MVWRNSDCGEKKGKVQGTPQWYYEIRNKKPSVMNIDKRKKERKFKSWIWIFERLKNLWLKFTKKFLEENRRIGAFGWSYLLQKI